MGTAGKAGPESYTGGMEAGSGNGVSAGGSASGPRVIAMMNQKGGVGKTTTTVNLAAAIAEAGKRTLVIDLDPQAHATLHLGVDPGALDEGLSEDAARSAYDVIMDPAVDATSAIRKVRERLSVLPAETDLAGIETQLAEVDPGARARRLREALTRIGSAFDYVLIDCPPSLGVLTLNGLAAAGEVMIPMQAHFLALQGVSKLLETVTLVRQSVNPGLKVSGVIVCMYDAQATHSKEVLDDLRTFLQQSAAGGQDVAWKGAAVLEPAVRRNIKLAECPSFGQTIFDYAPWCPGALDYRALAQSVIAASSEGVAKVKVQTTVKSRSGKAAAGAGA